MANTFTKLPLSGSVDGKRILITATVSGSATPIHTATNAASTTDEIWLYAYNEATSSLTLSLLWGGTTEPDDVIRASIPSQTGRVLLIDGALIQNGLLIGAYASFASSISVDGFVNRIEVV